MSKQNQMLKDFVHDKELIDFFFLDNTLEELIERIHKLSFSFFKDISRVPFYAQVRGYIGAVDSDDHFWIVKKIDDSDLMQYVTCELVYFLDFELQTLSAPSITVTIDNEYYRATKVVLNAIQVGSYDYLQEPMRKIIAKDLINRWWFFDEDRNPNNYMVLHNSKNDIIVVAIDFNHSDLLTEEMTITGNEQSFGWHRTAQTRFLTLLKPTNFDSYSIEDFENRLSRMMNFSEKRLRNLCSQVIKSIIPDYEPKCDLVVSNLLKRREYINNYFRTWFKTKKETPKAQDSDEYASFGKYFNEIYKKKL